ncbi:MAG TPA: CopG family antitoxin [Chloroflexota bacterium]|nr:CopG family antitoxin [Chloroflexota bacterium]
MTYGEYEGQRAEPHSKSRIPTFKTIEEEAAFWDTHDSAEFEDEFEDVTDVRFVRGGPKKGLTVRLEEETIAALTAEARRIGVGASTLARIWILERLRQEQSHPTRR